MNPQEFVKEMQGIDRKIVDLHRCIKTLEDQKDRLREEHIRNRYVNTKPGLCTELEEAVQLLGAICLAVARGTCNPPFVRSTENAEIHNELDKARDFIQRHV